MSIATSKATSTKAPRLSTAALIEHRSEQFINKQLEHSPDIQERIRAFTSLDKNSWDFLVITAVNTLIRSEVNYVEPKHTKSHFTNAKRDASAYLTLAYERLAFIQKAMGVSQFSMANIIGVPYNTFKTSMGAGRIKSITIVTAAAESLNIPCSIFFDKVLRSPEYYLSQIRH